MLQMPVKIESPVKLKDEDIALERKIQQLDYETEVLTL